MNTVPGERICPASFRLRAKLSAPSMASSTSSRSEQRHGAGAERGARAVLARGDHGDGEAFIAAEAAALRRIDLDAALGRILHRAHPAGELGHQRLGRARADGARELLPGNLPAADVAGLETLQPAAEADPDETLGGGEHGGCRDRGVARRAAFLKGIDLRHQLVGP